MVSTVQCQDAQSLKPLCSMRWTLKAASLQSVASNYSAIMEFLEDLCLCDKGEAGGKANGLLSHFQKFGTFFMLKLLGGGVFLRTETVNTALQKSQLHLQKAAAMIEMLKDDIKHLRENGFEEFWKNTTAAADELS